MKFPFLLVLVPAAAEAFIISSPMRPGLSLQKRVNEQSVNVGTLNIMVSLFGMLAVKFG
jgi:hypothetical protein